MTHQIFRRVNTQPVKHHAHSYCKLDQTCSDQIISIHLNSNVKRRLKFVVFGSLGYNSIEKARWNATLVVEHIFDDSLTNKLE